MRSFRNQNHKIDFDALNRVALPTLPYLCRQWLPNGKLRGREWVALNPKRPDRNKGSFQINVKTGRWADFATGDKGGDVVSLYAYLNGCSQTAAARALKKLIGEDVR